MKKLFALSLVATLGYGVAYADDEADYPTRTLRAHHATTTGSPAYADYELDRNRVEREEAQDRDAWMQEQGITSSDREFIEPKNEYDYYRWKETMGYRGRRGLPNRSDF